MAITVEINFMNSPAPFKFVNVAEVIINRGFRDDYSIIRELIIRHEIESEVVTKINPQHILTVQVSASYFFNEKLITTTTGTNLTTYTYETIPDPDRPQDAS